MLRGHFGATMAKPRMTISTNNPPPIPAYSVSALPPPMRRYNSTRSCRDCCNRFSEFEPWISQAAASGFLAQAWGSDCRWPWPHAVPSFSCRPAMHRPWRRWRLIVARRATRPGAARNAGAGCRDAVICTGGPYDPGRVIDLEPADVEARVRVTILSMTELARMSSPLIRGSGQVVRSARSPHI